MLKALIFDFDGVVMDSEVPRFSFLEETLRKRGIVLQEEMFTKLLGTTTKKFLYDAFVETIGQQSIQEILEEYGNIYKKNILQYVKPVPVIIDFIKTFSGNQRLALVTNGEKKYVDIITKYLGIFDKFSVIVTRDQV